MGASLAPSVTASIGSFLRNRRPSLHHCCRRRFLKFVSPQLPVSRICTTWHSSPSSTRYSACKVSCSHVKIEETINDEACELVNGVELSIGDGVDSIRAYLFQAVKNNNGIGILLLSDIFGFENSSTRDFAYRVACNGYNVLVPDLFRGNPWANDKPKALFEKWLAKQNPQRVIADVMASAKWMIDEFAAAGILRKLEVIGFSFGGGRVLDVLAQDQGSCFGTGVSFYGTKIDPSIAADVKVPILFIAGDSDPHCPTNLLEDMKNQIGLGSSVVIFEGRGHGFAHRPQSPEEDADAEQAFMELRGWLSDGLVGET